MPARRFPFALLLLVCLSGVLHAQTLTVRNAAGVEMRVDPADHDPVLSITLPVSGSPDSRTFKILVPEHITVRPHGQVDAEHLYVYAHDPAGLNVAWKEDGATLQYEKSFGSLHLLARATLADDGVQFHYEFTNSGSADFDMVTAVTDPRFRTVFYDPRLERTYVHHPSGFGLLAEHTPERLSMPLAQWFPVRYLASYTAPVPAELVQTRSDGITYRYSPDRVDLPMIATLSTDRTWVAASFSRAPGNVWSNPQLTCQHVDEEAPLPAGRRAVLEVKILLFAGTLQDALAKVNAERMDLH